MAKAKIGFEVDENDLASAKAYVAKHGGSLNKLVSSLFASLGQDEKTRPAPVDPVTGTLLAVSMGTLSIMEAARRLALPDAGYVFHLLAERNLPLPRLPDDFVSMQVKEAGSALDDCLVAPATPVEKRKAGKRPLAA